MTTQLTRLVCWVCGGAAILGGDVSVQETSRQDPADVLGGLMDE